MKFRACTVAALTAFGFLVGCGGGGSGSGSGSTPTGVGTTQTYDMGTLTTVNDGTQFSLKNAASGLMLGISGQSQTAGTVLAQESTASASDTLWHFLPMNSNSEYNIENLLTHQVMGISSASTASGAQAVQYSDNGTADHLWQFYVLSDGNYLIKNASSGLFLEDKNSDTSTSATIDQSARSTTSGCTCQEWTLTSTGNDAYPAPIAVTGTGVFVHDPYILQDPATHIYWLYGTHQTLAYSSDLSTFTYTTTSTAEGTCSAAEGNYWISSAGHCPIIGPDFSSWTGLQNPLGANSGKDTDVWAPSLLYANGAYYQYYAIPYLPSTGAEAVIGLATSNTPWGPWTDMGYVITSWTTTTSAVPSPNPWGFTSGTTWNAIDPAPFIDASGNWWLDFGSWSDGIRVVQLQSPTTATSTATIGFPVSADTTTWTKVAYRSGGEEGSFILPYVFNGTQYYYYFAPINTCCAGTNSTYREIVGRSTSPTGPFEDRGGVALSAGGGTILLSSHGNVYGPGGASVFIDTGSDGSKSIPTIVYHYYDGNNNGTPTLGINRLAFTSDGWPYVQ